MYGHASGHCISYEHSCELQHGLLLTHSTVHLHSSGKPQPTFLSHCAVNHGTHALSIYLKQAPSNTAGSTSQADNVCPPYMIMQACHTLLEQVTHPLRPAHPRLG